MKCLRKYNWVKLPREEIPKLKGNLGFWLHLAEHAAFRKGIATYCGHKNPVEPGMWSGGIVGIKKILGVRSREKALAVLDALKDMEYISYTLEETKKLTYRITDWVVECSGGECTDGTVYATPGHGFLCMPRNITERLVTQGCVFEEADAWLDLWCHTVFRDKGNAFSFLAPAIQYGKYGSVLTLETLGKRWGWEKTKVWRFFKKHGDVFSLHRLPSSYGCLIFNAKYPTGTVTQLPAQEDIMSILSEILISGNYTYTENSENAKVNHMVAWHSAKLITRRQAESALLEEECRVAPLAPITRAYLSHGWNCKHCRNCQYACRGNYKGQPEPKTEKQYAPGDINVFFDLDWRDDDGGEILFPHATG